MCSAFRVCANMLSSVATHALLAIGYVPVVTFTIQL